MSASVVSTETVSMPTIYAEPATGLTRRLIKRSDSPISGGQGYVALYITHKNITLRNPKQHLKNLVGAILVLMDVTFNF